MAAAAALGTTVSSAGCRSQATGDSQSAGHGLRATGYGQSPEHSDRSPSPVARSRVAARAAAAALLCTLACTGQAATYAVVVSGLGGEANYEQRFREQAATVATAAQKLTGDAALVTSLIGETVTRDSLRRDLRALAGKVKAEDQLIVVMIGHGTYDGEEYRFNLPGPDPTGTEILQLLDQIPARDQLIINASSASGAVVERWKRPRRIVITATKSGGERTATRFAEYWAQALSSQEADVNKDELVSAAEAFEFASRKVADAFKADQSLATEHARLEGENAARFAVARFGSATVVSDDPELAALYSQRVELERDLNAVKDSKETLTEVRYYDDLEAVLVKIARLQQQIDAKQPNRGRTGE
jgi:hypothetical protein